MKNDEAAWMAGFLEGEGCFFISPTKSPGIKVCLTDKDVLDKYAALTGRTVRGPYSDNRPGYKDRWEVNVYGQPACDIMLQIRPWMGVRRGRKIDHVLSEAREHKLKRPIPNRKMKSTCHKSTPRYHSSGLCRNCYERMRRKNLKRKDGV